MSLKALKETLSSRVRDKFEVGTTIRWTASDRYTYAAIKTPAGWYTTSSTGNPFVPKCMDFDELVEVLGRSEVSGVAVATAWEPVLDEEPDSPCASGCKPSEGDVCGGPRCT